MSQPELAQITRDLLGHHPLLEQSLLLDMGLCKLQIKTNSAELLERLRHYFAHALCAEPAVAELEIFAIEAESAEVPVEFTDWAREPGKRGRKDAFYDFDGGRLIRKVRTGMLFLQSLSTRIAYGPCLANDSQVINFANTQYMIWLQHRDWLTCHASALVYQQQALAFAGFSGGGKSTLMLHALDNPDCQYLSNDRLFIHRQEGKNLAAGIPKLPRINPGTALNNAKLLSILPTERAQELQNWPPAELWQLEEKYDVFISEIYGENRCASTAELAAFVVLNWQHGSQQATELKPVAINQRRDLLAAIMKQPGSFYHSPEGDFDLKHRQLNEELYIDYLQGVKVYEATGQVNFEQLKNLCLHQVFGI